MRPMKLLVIDAGAERIFAGTPLSRAVKFCNSQLGIEIKRVRFVDPEVQHETTANDADRT